MKFQIDFGTNMVLITNDIDKNEIIKILQIFFPEKWKLFKIEYTDEYKHWHKPIEIKNVHEWNPDPWKSHKTGSMTYSTENMITTSIIHNGLCNIKIK